MSNSMVSSIRDFGVILLLFHSINSSEWNDSSEEQLTTEWAEMLTDEPDITGRSCSSCNCYCVPVGHCKKGSNIDIRIVNTGNGCPTGTAVCCLQPGPPPPSPRPPPPPTRPPGWANACGQRALSPPPGDRPTGQAYFGEYPWQVMLLNADGHYVGSGVLLAPRFVLTVAHVLPSSDSRALRVRLGSFGAGEWDVGASAAGSAPLPPLDVAVGRIAVCPDFDADSLAADVALLELVAAAPPPETTPHIRAACLPTPGVSYAGQRCWVSGWGRDAFGPQGRWQRRQRSVDVTVLAAGQCEARLRATRLGPDYSLDARSFLCAGGEQGKDACSGDGGAPLVCAGPSGWEVVGLVSWGVGCGDEGVPGVYTNVASFAPWVLNQMQPPPPVTDPRADREPPVRLISPKIWSFIFAS